MNLYEFGIFIIFFGVLIFFQLRHDAVVKDMANRIMAKNLPEYHYYADKWKGDLKEIATVREETREELREEIKTAKKEEADEGDEDLF